MDKYRSLLQQYDLKSTPARLAVLGFLDHERRPQDVDTIEGHLKLEHEEADKVTIYRILDAFAERGLVNRLEFGEGKFRYELAGDDHHHLICERCGSIEDIEDCFVTSFEKTIHDKTGFRVKRHSLEFFGVCVSCQR